MNRRISEVLINRLLYYIFRSQRFDSDIVDVNIVSKGEVMYADIYEEYRHDMEFNYFSEANYLEGAATAYATAFTEFVRAVLEREHWRYLKGDDSMRVIAYNGDGRDEIVLFDYSSAEDRALLDEDTIYEIEKVLAGPDFDRGEEAEEQC